MSPVFTGHQIRQIFELIRECADEVDTFFLQNNHATAGVRNVWIFGGRYANDVIASEAFGLKINSHKDRD